jgi:solute:Na+ symporter, SSS family
MIWDLIVIIAYFAAVIGIGLSQRDKSGSLEGFALGNRQIAWWAVLASILAAEISAGTFFGTPGEGFALRNFTYVQLILGYVLARVVVSAVFIPAYYRHNVVSIYEFLEIRFGPLTRRVASAVFLVTRALASGTRLWVPSILVVIAFKTFSGHTVIDPWQEFGLYAGALIFITVLTAMYTAHGGMRAVIWTDVIQVVVLFSALGFSFFFLLSKVPGGWEGVKAHLGQPGIAQPEDLKVISWGSPDPAHPGLWGWIKGILEQEYTMWAALLGSTFVTLATHGTDQDMVQRMLTAKNQRQSGFATIVSGIIDIPVVLVVLAIGIMLKVFYDLNPSAQLLQYANAKTGVLAPKANEVFPQFILTQMPVGLRGLVIAGVLATTMGSLGTALNALATSYVRDFHFRWFGEPPTDAGKVKALRTGTVLFAVILVSIGLATAGVVALQPQLRILPIILGVFGYTYGSLLGVFMVGLFTTTRGNCRGNVIGMVAGFIWVSLLSGLDTALLGLVGVHADWRPDGFPIIEFPWRILFGSVVTFLVAVSFRREALDGQNAPSRS